MNYQIRCDHWPSTEIPGWTQWQVTDGLTSIEGNDETLNDASLMMQAALNVIHTHQAQPEYVGKANEQLEWASKPNA